MHGGIESRMLPERIAQGAWGEYFVPAGEASPAVSETIRLLARSPSDVYTARLPKARDLLENGFGLPTAGFRQANFSEAINIFCYLGTWTLASRSGMLKPVGPRPPRSAGGAARRMVPAADLATLSGIPETTVSHALFCMSADGAVFWHRQENGRLLFSCDASFFIT